MSSETPPSRPPEVHAWLQALFDESPMAIGFSRDGVMLDANPAFVRLFGYPRTAALRGRSLLDLIAPSDRTRVTEMVARRALGQPAPEHYQTRGIRPDGTEFPFEVTTTRVVLADGPLAIAFIADVSEREDAIEALRASEERFRTLSAAAFEGVFVHAEGKIAVANEAGAAMYGFDPDSMVGASLMDLTAPESRASVLDHVRRGASEPYEGVARRKDGSTFFAEVRGRTLVHQGKPMRVAIIRDVTERKRADAEQRALTERVRQTQKLESLGVLAGGVAHDFNNILTVISNGVALVERDRRLGLAAAGHLHTIALATQRAADLCRQMLAYAGMTAIAREPLDLSAIVGEMGGMLEVSVGAKATLVRELAPGLPTMVGDATQVRQVVMNLVLNAAEAITRPEGRVVVSTGAGVLGAEDLARCAAGDGKPGPHVFLEVRDDGVGMDAQTVARMFDPFFTTKFVGRGLGMAAVLGIVRGHSGAIDVESSPGKGTRIRVHFPTSASKPATRPPSPPLDEEAPKGRGVILLVDDEKNVRISTRMLLQELGFEVLLAADGLEAIEVFRARSDRIGAVLMDLTMPRMDGMETLREMRRIAPRVPVVLTSGYGSSRLDSPGRGQRNPEPDAVLPKPYGVAELLSTLRQVMH